MPGGGTGVTTAVAGRADSREGLEDDLTRSVAILRVAGFRCYRLGDQLAPWHLQAVCSWGHALVHVFRGEWPSRLGVDPFCGPPGWSPLTRRFQHRWGDDALPEVREL